LEIVRLDRADHNDLVAATARSNCLQAKPLRLDHGKRHRIGLEACDGTDYGHVRSGARR
jgi:hypothetical protein